MRAQLGLHVDPRRIGALGEQARMPVHDRVQDLEAEVAHADLVDVREAQAHARVGTVPGLLRLALLAAQVARGLLHLVNEARVGVLSCLFAHAWWIPWRCSIPRRTCQAELQKAKRRARENP